MAPPPAPPSRMTSIAAWVQPRSARGQSPPAASPVGWGQHGVGLQFEVADQGCLLIARMEGGGPAARSGVCMIGDELLKVDGAVVERASLDAVQERLGGRAGSTVSLTLRRARQNLPPMVYEVELVRGDAEFMEAQARNKVLSREHATMASQVEELQAQLQAKEAKLGDMVRDLNEFDAIASRAQEARRLAEQQRDQANAEAFRFKNQQKNIDQHVDRLVGELRDKEKKLQQLTGAGRSRSTSPAADTATSDADAGRTAVMGDASVPLDDSCAASTPREELTLDQLQAELAHALAARNDLKLLLDKQRVLTQEADNRSARLEQQLKERAADLERQQQVAGQNCASAEKLAADALAAKGEADAQLEQARQQCHHQKQVLQEYNDRNESLTAQLSRSQQDSAAALKKAEEEATQLKLMLSSTKEQLKVCEEKLHAYAVRNDITMEGLNAETTRSQQLSTAHQQLQGAHRELQQQFTVVQQELAEAQKLLHEHKQRAAADSKMDATALKQFQKAEENEVQMTSLRRQVEEAHIECEELKSSNEYLQKSVKDLERDLKTRESKASEDGFSAAQKMEVMGAELNASKTQLVLLQDSVASSQEAMARLEADNTALRTALEKVHASLVSEKRSFQKELQQLQHELATVCLCIVTHDVDLATLISDEEPLSALGDAASGCKLFTRELYQHTLGILKDAKTPRMLLCHTQAHDKNSKFSAPETPIKVHVGALQRQMTELQTQMQQMRQQGEQVGDSKTGQVQNSVSSNKSDCSIDKPTASKAQDWLVKHEPGSDINKENEDNKGIPVSVRSNSHDVKKVKSLRTNASTPPPHAGTRSPTAGAPTPSSDAENIRTEHQVVSNAKPLCKPLVMATRVTQVYSSPPPTENARDLSNEHHTTSCDAPEDDFVVAPKVSKLKAMFESSDSGSETKQEFCPKATNTSGSTKFVQIKSPRPSRSSLHSDSVIKSDVHDAKVFDSSTAPTDLENKLMGPIFASQKTGAALLQEGNNGEYQADDTMEAVCNDTTNNSTSISLQVDEVPDQLSPLYMSPLADDPTSLISKYLNMSADDCEVTYVSGTSSNDKLKIPVSPVGDPLEGPLRSPQEIVSAMRITDIKSALKGGNQVKSTKTQKRSNIEFNENLSEVRLFTPDKVKYADQLFGAAEVQAELQQQQQSLFQDFIESGYVPEELVADSYGAVEAEEPSLDDDLLYQNTRYNASSLHSFC